MCYIKLYLARDSTSSLCCGGSNGLRGKHFAVLYVQQVLAHLKDASLKYIEVCNKPLFLGMCRPSLPFF